MPDKSFACMIGGRWNVNRPSPPQQIKDYALFLANGKAMHKDIGGTSLQIEIDNTPVFVKKVPLTELEMQAENYMSTANIFNLPMRYP